MLDTETKRRIDSARDILVGKVPDPKAQVEQITTALVYKFMDDMDKESVELGGKAQFFKNGYAQYAWSKLMDSRLGGHERLALYGEAITKLSENPNIPQLFRNIFKDAFLPYRDPETLNLFLKEINGFIYDHSERLGDAYEYLLSVLGSQGDAGQFRTPRHIIDFIVKVVDPDKHDTILDPACGTAGFLISAFKHILGKYRKNNPGDLMTPAERKKFMGNFAGYDISPDMVRIALVNMYLHGFPNPNIPEYDTLTSEEKWDELYDVILANPPFMSPKGGIRPHKRFSVQVNRSEVLFVDYIMEHLTIKGRAGIIVPEGIVFQSQTAFRQLRQKLVKENYLFAVVDLPAGVFNPYSGVKTSILFLDKERSRKSDTVFFIKINNDGYSLGAQRKPITQNDLPTVLDALNLISTNQQFDEKLCKLVQKQDILNNSDASFAFDRYISKRKGRNNKWQYCPIVDVAIEMRAGFACGESTGDSSGIPHLRPMNIDINGELVWDGTKFISKELFANKQDYKLKRDDILFNNTNSKELVGKTCYIAQNILCGFSNHMTRIRVDNLKINPKYLAYLLHHMWRKNVFLLQCNKWVGQAGINIKALGSIEIPLPDLSMQEKLVLKIDDHKSRIASMKKTIIEQESAVIELLADVWGK